MLHWIAPADDNGTGGRISSYDLRYSTATISAANWDAATQVTGEPAPAAPGQQEVFTRRQPVAFHYVFLCHQVR